MSWKDILIITDADERGADCVSAAAALARRLDATLHICIPAVAPSASGWGDLPLSSEVLGDIMAEVREQTAKAAKAFELAAALSKARVLQHQFDTSEVSLAGDAAVCAQTADLVVVVQPSLKHRIPGAAAILEGVLLGSGRPVLMLPEDVKSDHLGSRVLVGWKPVREAARALHDAMPLLKGAEAVRLFTGTDVSIGAGEYATRVSVVADHLRHHGVQIADGDQQPLPRGVGVLEAAKIWGADMIVMGAYGHSRLQERVFGGATRDAIGDAHIPVLFSH